MNTYEVTITEQLERKVLIDAEKLSDAIRSITDQYNSSDIILTADDFTGDVKITGEKVDGDKVFDVEVEEIKSIIAHNIRASTHVEAQNIVRERYDNGEYSFDDSYLEVSVNASQTEEN